MFETQAPSLVTGAWVGISCFDYIYGIVDTIKLNRATKRILHSDFLKSVINFSVKNVMFNETNGFLMNIKHPKMVQSESQFIGLRKDQSSPVQTLQIWQKPFLVSMLGFLGVYNSYIIHFILGFHITIKSPNPEKAWFNCPRPTCDRERGTSTELSGVVPKV